MAATQTSSWLERGLSIIARPRTGPALTAVATLMGACFLATYLAGGANYLAASLFCLPVVLAGAYFRYTGAVLSAMAASILAGPLIPLDISSHLAQPPSLWVGRGVIFMIVGLLTASASERLRISFQRELTLAQEQRDLAMSKAALIETVSREFRSPLSVIRGIGHALQQAGSVREEVRPMMVGLETSTQRLVDLVTAVSAVLELEERAPLLGQDVFSVEKLLARVIDHLGVTDPQGRVRVSVERHARACICDAELLSQLLRHLMENAVRFSDDLVEVEVSRPSDDMFMFRISDRGPGLTDDYLRFASEPFSRTSGAHGRSGLGLGLFASFRIADVLGGSLSLDPRPSGGSVATALIPATSPEPWLA
jgi:signal transduction histidine kinase